MIKGAPVTPEASTISGASATTEVQNNSAEVQNNSASASDPVDAEAPAMILIPLELCVNSRILINIAGRAMPAALLEVILNQFGKIIVPM